MRKFKFIFNKTLLRLPIHNPLINPRKRHREFFFISAKEVLKARSEKKRIKEFSIGCVSRFNQFEDFEHKFEECISKSVIKIKFKNHAQQEKYLLE